MATETDSFRTALLAALQDAEVRDAFGSILEATVINRLHQLEERLFASESWALELQLEVGKLTKEKDALAKKVSNLQQYSRRNSLRVTNPAWREPDDSKDDNTDALILGL